MNHDGRAFRNGLPVNQLLTWLGPLQVRQSAESQTEIEVGAVTFAKTTQSAIETDLSRV